MSQHIITSPQDTQTRVGTTKPKYFNSALSGTLAGTLAMTISTAMLNQVRADEPRDVRQPIPPNRKVAAQPHNDRIQIMHPHAEHRHPRILSPPQHAPQPTLRQ